MRRACTYAAGADPGGVDGVASHPPSLVMEPHICIGMLNEK